MDELTELEYLAYELKIARLEDELKNTENTNFYLNNYVDRIIKERNKEHYDIHAILREVQTGKLSKGLALDYIRLRVGYRQ